MKRMPTDHTLQAGKSIGRYRLPLLGVVALALVWLNLGTSPDKEVVNAVARPGATPTLPDPANTPGGSLTKGLNTSTQQLNRPMLELSEVDPFAPAPKPIDRVKPALPPPMTVAVIAEPPPPEPPPLNLLYAGRMTTPDGSFVVYATMGDTSMALTPGLDLPNGYRVTKITARAVELSYPALNRTTRLEIPPAQKYETR